MYLVFCGVDLKGILLDSFELGGLDFFDDIEVFLESFDSDFDGDMNINEFIEF